MNDTVKRTLRTFLQGFLGVFIASGVLSALATDGFIDLAVISKAFVSAITAGIIAVVTYAQNLLEDKNVIPEVIKK